MSSSVLEEATARRHDATGTGPGPARPSRAARTASLGGYLLLLVVPSVLTVLRYTADFLNADGVEQSTMSVQGVRLFYWGQDRLLPVPSILASPIADPTANLWTCLVLQALSFYGLLLLIAHRVNRALRTPVPGGTALVYLALVVAANGVLSARAIHSFALEGQPYALSWLLAGLAYEAWRRGGLPTMAAGAVAGVVALGLNPSAVLLAAFLAVTDGVRERRWVRWVGFLVVFGVGFVLWSALASRYGMYPTPARDPAPSYLGFTTQLFASGWSVVLDNFVAQVRPVRTVALGLVALLATTLLTPQVRARLLSFGAFFAGFTLLYVALFAGNDWVMLNGYHFRYFFPLQVLLVLGVAVPVSAALLRGVEVVSSRRRNARPQHLVVPLLVLGLVAAGLAMAGPLTRPGDAVVLEQHEATARFAQTRDIRFLSGAYWNMWPLMHDLLGPGRDAVYVAGLKTAGNRADYRAVLDRQIAMKGRAGALCVNDTARSCIGYLDYWTRPGWRVSPGRVRCPAPPSLGPSQATGDARRCVVLVNDGSSS